MKCEKIEKNGWWRQDKKRGRRQAATYLPIARHCQLSASKATEQGGVRAVASRPTIHAACRTRTAGWYLQTVWMQLEICEAACRRGPLAGNWQARVGPCWQRGTLASHAPATTRERATPKRAPEIQFNAATQGKRDPAAHLTSCAFLSPEQCHWNHDGRERTTRPPSLPICLLLHAPYSTNYHLVLCSSRCIPPFLLIRLVNQPNSFPRTRPQPNVIFVLRILPRIQQHAHRTVITPSDCTDSLTFRRPSS